MARLIQAFISVLVVSIGLLLVGGVVLDMIQAGYCGYESFFKYRIRMFNRLPFWFAAVLFQLAINGIWIPKLSRLFGQSEFSPFRERGRVSWDIPVQYGILLGRNLALVCAIILVYVVVQKARI